MRCDAKRLQAPLGRLEVGRVLLQARVQVLAACRDALAVLRGKAERGGHAVGGDENEQDAARARAHPVPVAPLPGDEERQQRLQPVERDRQPAQHQARALGGPEPIAELEIHAHRQRRHREHQARRHHRPEPAHHDFRVPRPSRILDRKLAPAASSGH